MGVWAIPISILMFYAALFLFANLWFEELLQLNFLIQLYLVITYVAIKWCFYLGSKHYRVTYSTTKDEAGVEHYIEFPIIWM
jgi:hypothetical protein